MKELSNKNGFPSHINKLQTKIDKTDTVD